jgi:formylglycine-generating enzyme required for sulfatase activity
MVLVPEGKFTMGTSERNIEQWLRAHPKDKREWFEDEQPQHSVFLKAFYMDQYEVTTKRYQAFMNDAGWGEPEYWSRTIPVSQAEKPVVGVTWDDAQAYCEHYGKRLPTEAEWEKAARGTDGRFYPWGNEAPTSRHANFDRGYDFKNYEVLTAVGSRSAGASPYGVQDMAGNVWEWVADLYDENYYQNSPKDNPEGANEGKYRVIRGGSWNYDAWNLRSSNRVRNLPTLRSNLLGFRCARNAP